MRLVACINVYQDAALLARCLPAIRPLVDRLVVVDGRYADFPAYDESTPSSTDGTLDVAREHGAAVIDPPNGQPWVDEVVKRNAYIRACEAGDWLLVVDADEIAEGVVDRALLADGERSDWAVQHYNETDFRNRVLIERIDPDVTCMRVSLWIHRLYRWRAGMEYREAHNALFVDGALVHPVKLGDDPANRFPGLRLKHVQNERPYERVFRKERYYMRLTKTEEGIRKRYCF